MTDPIADMLTRIRNALQVEKVSVRVPNSSVKRAIARVLKEEGYIDNVVETSDGDHPMIEITLKYFEGQPVISAIDRTSKPGLRIYRGRYKLPRVSAGLGVAIVSTSKGVMTDREARRQGLGGEVLCTVN
ncbi:MAG: 30S ribosomal protein S8 [Pseudomonadota bacterium]